ncbi:hypothetical protein [Paenibacillus silvisoli]|uniref:hypothetical protein n=1 Tax=Paenibacillus silvisoli TaxID=3110539 RepID=UPI002805FD9C|nr:hypothetical protein [Paenibacillus silvisoli]
MRFCFGIIATMCVFLLSSCSNNEVKPDSPVNTAHLMKLSIDYQDYDRFNQLFSEGRADSVPKSEFEKLKTLTSAGTQYNNYELLKFENGKMLLVRLAPPNEAGEIFIEDVKVIPEELSYLFSDDK